MPWPRLPTQRRIAVGGLLEVQPELVARAEEHGAHLAAGLGPVGVDPLVVLVDGRRGDTDDVRGDDVLEPEVDVAALAGEGEGAALADRPLDQEGRVDQVDVGEPRYPSVFGSRIPMSMMPPIFRPKRAEKLPGVEVDALEQPPVDEAGQAAEVVDAIDRPALEERLRVEGRGAADDDEAARPGGRATPGSSSMTRSGSPRVPAARSSSSGRAFRLTTSRGGRGDAGGGAEGIFISVLLRGFQPVGDRGGFAGGDRLRRSTGANPSASMRTRYEPGREVGERESAVLGGERRSDGGARHRTAA